MNDVTIEAISADSLGSSRVSGSLAFAICLICHQILVFAIARWTNDIEAWRGLTTSLGGVAGLSIGSVGLPWFLSPVLAAALAALVITWVYDFERWKFWVVSLGWLVWGAISMLAIGALFGEPEPEPTPEVEMTAEELLQLLTTPPNPLESANDDSSSTPPESPADSVE